MQAVVSLLLPCQTLFSAGLANIADDSRTALSYVWVGQLKLLKTDLLLCYLGTARRLQHDISH